MKIKNGILIFIYLLIVAGAGFLVYLSYFEFENQSKVDEDDIISVSRAKLRNGEFAGFKNFNLVARDYGHAVDDVSLQSLLDCHLYYFYLSEKSLSKYGTSPTGSFEGLDLPKAQRYRYELSYVGLEKAIARRKRSYVSKERNNLPKGLIAILKFGEYEPTSIRECRWKHNADAPPYLIMHEWYCAEGYYDRKSNYSVEEYIGHLPDYCDGLITDYLENGEITEMLAPFVPIRPEFE